MRVYQRVVLPNGMVIEAWHIPNRTDVMCALGILGVVGQTRYFETVRALLLAGF